MNPRDLGKTRTTPINQLKYGMFGHVYKGEIRTQEPHVTFIVHDSVKPTTQLIPLHRVELKKKVWTEKGIIFKQLGQ